MTESDKQTYINETIVSDIKEIKTMFKDLIERVDSVGTKVAAHDEKFAAHDQSLNVLHLKTWEIATRFYWTILAACGTLGLSLLAWIIMLLFKMKGV